MTSPISPGIANRRTSRRTIERGSSESEPEPCAAAPLCLRQIARQFGAALFQALRPRCLQLHFQA